MTDVEYPPIDSLDMKDFLKGQRAVGRADLKPEIVSFWADQHRRATRLLRDPATGRRARASARLLKELAFPLAAQEVDPVPTYYPYTGVHLLDWYLGDRHQNWDRLKVKVVEGIYFLILELIRFESQSLTGVETCHRERFDRDIVTERLRVLERAVAVCRNLSEKFPAADLDRDRGSRRFPQLKGYVREKSRLSAMIEFSCMPQTRFHDEVIFLRTIHIAEFCFYGIRIAVREAQELLRKDLTDRAIEPLEEAVAFGAMLYESFKVLRTMPPEHFIDFRDATGHASAIQSLNYQLMEIHLRGVHQGKAETFQRIPHLRQLGKFAHPGFVHLKQVLGEADADAAGWSEVVATARALDQKWLTWRGLHLSFALLYLPPAAKGTGDTEGAPYLKKFLRAGLFDNTTVDLTLMEELFGNDLEIPNLFRVRPGLGISPAEDVRAYRAATTES